MTQDVEDPNSSRDLTTSIRASLSAKLERLLQRPIIAQIPRAKSPPPAAARPIDDFMALLAATESVVPSQRHLTWHKDPTDGTWVVPVEIDYWDLWRGREKDVREEVLGCVESEVAFLTDEQKELLERSPREFLDLTPRPETAELVDFDAERVGGAERVVRLRVANLPESQEGIRHVALVPNLIPLERQLDGLKAVEGASDEGPLGPLRVLLGIADDVEAALTPSHVPEPLPPMVAGDRIDAHQAECIDKALSTPHFAVIKGPPGSGKTTVITSILQRALAQGQRVLVISPTHVAVDNVIEKLVPGPGDADDLDPSTLPVRYSARTNKLSAVALKYWVSKENEKRGATIAKRVEARLTSASPLAKKLFAQVDRTLAGRAPLSGALARTQRVVCGTPLGILSCAAVKESEPGSWDLLIVDEVSKLTLPEFLAVAVKARRWVAVGDPDQLPPFNNGEENSVALDDVLSPVMELACSVGALMERERPFERHLIRQLVVCRDPKRAVEVIAAHLEAVLPEDAHRVSVFGDGVPATEFVACLPEEAEAAFLTLTPIREADVSNNPRLRGSVSVLVERGLRFERPAVAGGLRLMEVRRRAQAVVFEKAYDTYHAQPWAQRSGLELGVVSFRKGLNKALPSARALEAEADLDGGVGERRVRVLDQIAERFAVNTVSVYDWLTGVPTGWFDVSPLTEVEALPPKDLMAAVAPYVGTLKRQYRMHPSLSAVPRELFYFGDALHDGLPGGGRDRISLLQVERQRDGVEVNEDEAEAIAEILKKLNANWRADAGPIEVMLITPYRKQERLLERMVEDLRRAGDADKLYVEVCTLDRCQGREAKFVFISLVRNRATPFMDNPKRWNVALTRAMEGLFLVGDIQAFSREASKAHYRSRRGVDGRPRLRMSLLARIIEAYEDQRARPQRMAR